MLVPLKKRADDAEQQASDARQKALELEEELRSTRRSLVTAEAALEAEQQRAAELMTILGEAAVSSEASAARAEQAHRFAAGRAENILHKVYNELNFVSRFEAWAEWAENEVRIRRVCKGIAARLLGNDLSTSLQQWADAAREEKRLRRAQTQCARRWLLLLLREYVGCWKAAVEEGKQSDLVKQAKNAAQLIKETQERLQRQLSEVIESKDVVIKRVEARCV
jgi:hypothetical protein